MSLWLEPSGVLLWPEGKPNDVCRCGAHPPKGSKRRYVTSVLPVGFPETAVVSGSTLCVWLEEHELEAYNRGSGFLRRLQ